MKVLITGADGQLGKELVRSAPAGITVRACGRSSLDITHMGSVRAILDDFGPDLVINAAAYTLVDNAEREREAAWALNSVAPAQLADAVNRLKGCRLVHVSTDYVFDGDSARAHRPEDQTAPLNVYGESKLAGERGVFDALKERAVVVRTAWVYAGHGRNFLQTMLKLMRERGAVRVVADQIGTPTAAPALANVLWAFGQRRDLSGLFHWTDAGVASWYDFAVAIAEEAMSRRMLEVGISVTPIASSEYPTPARRPCCSILDKTSSMIALSCSPRHWRTELRSVLDGMCNA